jgi:hypothetical protein
LVRANLALLILELLGEAATLRLAWRKRVLINCITFGSSNAANLTINPTNTVKMNLILIFLRNLRILRIFRILGFLGLNQGEGENLPYRDWLIGD